jgi:hypothetical protein
MPLSRWVLRSVSVQMEIRFALCRVLKVPALVELRRRREKQPHHLSFSDGGYVEDDVRYGLSLLNLSKGPGATTPEPSGYFKTNEGELESSLRSRGSAPLPGGLRRKQRSRSSQTLKPGKRNSVI